MYFQRHASFKCKWYWWKCSQLLLASCSLERTLATYKSLGCYMCVNIYFFRQYMGTCQAQIFTKYFWTPQRVSFVYLNFTQIKVLLKYEQLFSQFSLAMMIQMIQNSKLSLSGTQTHNLLPDFNVLMHRHWNISVRYIKISPRYWKFSYK